MNIAGWGSLTAAWHFTLSRAVIETTTVTQGWNLLSIPVAVSDYRKALLFPTALSQAFSYEGKYIQHDTLVQGIGYWVKFDSSELIVITGEQIVADTIDVRKGWNLIGTISTSVAVDSVRTLPPGILASSFFGYQQTHYVVTSILLPLHAYWVKTKEAGKLILK
jgi:hypothetical protein